jgi:raffinose/stachyose/melibiose transport system permease protein
MTLTQTPPKDDTEAVVVPSRPRRDRRRPGLLVLGHWWWALPGIVLVLAIHYAATVAGGVFAFTDWSGIGRFDWIGLENFQRILADGSNIGALANTLFLAFAAVVLSNVLGLALALGTNRLVKSRLALRVLFFMPVVLSPLAVAYIWKFIFDFNGPLNSALIAVGLDDWARPWLADPALAIWAILVVLVWQNTGFCLVIYLAGLAAVPFEVEEAATVDGANVWQRFWHVTAPALRPAIAISTTLGIINGLRVFDQVMALTGGGPAGSTETLATLVYKEAFALGNFGYGAALALLLTLLILAFAILQQRATRSRPEES